MKVLVTGAAGFIGSHVVKCLESRGVDVVALDDFSHSDYRNLFDTKAELIWGDVSEPSTYLKLPKVDAVIHEAAVTDTTLADDTKMVKVNYGAFRNVINFCFEKNIPLIYASSAGVYGMASGKMFEDQKLTPHNVYAYSKYLCDLFAQEQSKSQKTPPVIGLRYFNVYGPGEAHKKKSASMVYQLYNQMTADKNPRIFKAGEQKRDFIYVKDVARITVDCLNLGKSLISNVGTGQPRSFNEMVSVLNNLMKKNLQPEYIDNPYIKVYQNYTEADTGVLKGILQNEAEYTLEKGIKDYLENYLL